jgi:hypothetical protein
MEHADPARMPGVTNPVESTLDYTHKDGIFRELSTCLFVTSSDCRVRSVLACVMLAWRKLVLTYCGTDVICTAPRSRKLRISHKPDKYEVFSMPARACLFPPLSCFYSTTHGTVLHNVDWVCSRTRTIRRGVITTLNSILIHWGSVPILALHQAPKYFSFQFVCSLHRKTVTFFKCPI